MPDPQHDPEDLELLIQHRLEVACAALRPPTNIAGWRRKVRSDELANEAAMPGFIASAARALREQATGVKITGWRETRGTHGIDYIADPRGTDRPPWI